MGNGEMDTEMDTEMDMEMVGINGINFELDTMLDVCPSQRPPVQWPRLSSGRIRLGTRAPERLAGDPALAAFVPGRDFHLGNPSADVVPKCNGSKWFKKWLEMVENG